MSIRKSLAIACLFAFFASTVSAAEGLHHVHLRVADREAAAQWYASMMGGEKTTFDDSPAVAFGDSLILFLPAKDGAESNVGSTLDHIGFSFQDLEAKMKEFEAKGVKIVAPIKAIGFIKYAFIDDPWGTRIEVMQDPNLYGFHHVHLHTPDPQAMLKWFTDNFGGKAVRYGGLLPAVRYGEVWLIAQPVKEEKSATKDRSADHIGFVFDDLDAALKKFEANGVKIDQQPEAFSGGRYAFVTAPNGLRLELLELKK